jgi:hypothetical protein
LTKLRANADGIFSGHVALSGEKGSVRARLANGTDFSLPFGLKPVPDRRVSPFGR